MRILHTSDWHIGRQFHNQSLLEDQQHVLNQIIECVKTDAVDVVIIAGDVYDRSVPPADAVAVLNQTLQCFCQELEVPVILISGNHDSAERLGFGAELMQSSGLHIFSRLDTLTDPVILSKDGTEVAFYGIPYCTPEWVRHTFDEPVKSFDEAHTFLVERIKANWRKDCRHVLVSHCFVSGGDVSESERPLSVGGADTVGWRPLEAFDYVALGHLHAPQKIGAEHIRYAGSLLKYSFSEVNQNKGVTLIDIEADRPVSIQHRSLTPKRDMRILEGAFADLLEQAEKDDRRDDYFLIRLTDKKAILDTLSQLRALYPNVLHLEKPGLDVDHEARLHSREQLKRTEAELFADFFEQAQGEAMSEEQQQALNEVIQAVHRAEEEPR